MEYQAGVHGTLIKKEAACLDRCCKEGGSGWGANTAEIRTQAPTEEFENCAKGRLKMAIRWSVFWTKWHPQHTHTHTQSGAHFWKIPDFKKIARWLPLYKILECGEEIDWRPLCRSLTLSPVYHWLPLSFHAVTSLLRREAPPFECLCAHWDKTSTSRSLVWSYLAESLGRRPTTSRWWRASTCGVYFGSLQG